MDYEKLNISAFEKKIGAGNNSIGTIINRNSNVSGQILSKILTQFSYVSAEWLLTGKGEMLKNVPKELFNTVEEPEEEYKTEKSIEAAQKKTISILENVVDDLRNDKEVLNTIIKSILNK